MKLTYLIFLPLFLLPAVAWALTSNTFSTDLERSSSQYWSRADNALLDFTVNYTLAAWVNVESTPSAGARYVIIGKWNNAAGARSYQWEYFDNAGTPTLRFLYSDSGAGVAEVFTEVTTLTPGTWYHLAMTFSGLSGSAEFKTYLNGTQLGTTDAVGADTFNGNEGFRIGAVRDASAPAFFWDGFIDDARVWSRVLSSTEILALATTPCTASNGASLSGWWLFDNNGDDSSGNSLTLTNNNSATFTTPAYACASFNPYYFNDF